MDTFSPESTAVSLPDGTTVSVSEKPQKWWTTQHGSGYVSPKLLAPDSIQPRRHINPDRLAELHRSIETRGVRETLTVTPLSHTPWVKVAPEYEDKFFLIVSGHRRWNGACLAKLGAVPVKVVIYQSEKYHRLDNSLLNSGREDLSPIEQGEDIVRLRDVGWKIAELSASFGLALPQLYGRMNLTQLHPHIQKLIDPKLPKKLRLSITVAGVLGGVKSPTLEELDEKYETFADFVEKGPDDALEDLDEDGRRFALQKLLLSVIQQRSLSFKRAIELIKEHTLRLRLTGAQGGRKPQRYQPRRRRAVLENLVGEITDSVVMDWTPAELKRIFELSTREDTEKLLAQIQEATEFLKGLSKLLGKIRDEKEPTHPDVLRIMEQTQSTAK